jgi:3,4-dihydroxy 2-butanone 4-phosphate synthase/GTP cyclohydrolase II
MASIGVIRHVCSRVPTPEGEFQLCLYTSEQDEKEHLALLMGDVIGDSDVMVRVHSECFTGDVLGSCRCDCGEQLKESMELIARKGSGLLIYLRQEGRGIGLLDKLRAYNLQDQGFDTVEANLILGHQVDERDYTIAAQILKDLGVKSIQLLTNNPEKMRALQREGIKVTRRLSLDPGVNPENQRYLETKALRMNHFLNINISAFHQSDNGNGRAS